METAVFSQLAQWFYHNQGLILVYGINIISALLTLIIGAYTAHFISRAAFRLMKRRKIDPTVASFSSNMLKYLILSVVIIAALGRIGVQTASFVAIVGAAGLAIGLALQGSLSNFAAGVLLITFRPLKTGEYVEAGGAAGTVESVQIFTTVLKTPDNKMVVIPNNNIFSGNIINYTRTGERRVDLTIGVSYSADLRKTRQVIEKILSSDRRILSNPTWTVGVCALADSSVNFAVRPWVKTDDYWAVFFDLHEKIKISLDEAGIEIPFPQQDIHLVSTAKEQNA